MNPIVEVLQAAGPILDRFLPDKTAQAKFINEMAAKEAEYSYAIQRSQIEVNKQEAAHRSIWVAGWRPFIGWVCGSAFAANFLILPIAKMVAAFQGIPFDVEPLDLSVMLPVLGGMLGLGLMRSQEKLKGVAK